MSLPTAILVDADNVIAGEHSGARPRIEDLLAGLRQRFGQASLMSVFFTGPPTGRSLRRQRNVLSAPQIARIEQAALAVKANVIRADRNVDLVLAVHAMEDIRRVKTFVLVSGDADFVPLLVAARRADVWSVLVSSPQGTSVALALAADERVDPFDLVDRVTGLIAPGDGEAATGAIIRWIQRASLRVAIIDPWVSEETVRLLAWSNPGVKLMLVGTRFTESAISESRDIARAGRNLALFKSTAVHDRWFSVDDHWWHSGGSLKDLGRKWTRISEIAEPGEIERTERLLESLAIQENIVRLA